MVAEKLELMPRTATAVGRYAGDSFGFIIEGDNVIQSMETCLDQLSEGCRASSSATVRSLTSGSAPDTR